MWGHQAAQCPKPVNEVNDKEEEATITKQASDTDAVAWGGSGINSVEAQWKTVNRNKHINEASAVNKRNENDDKQMRNNRYAILAEESKENEIPENRYER